MKFPNILTIISLAGILFFYSSCAKEGDPDGGGATVCKGKTGENAYFPMAVGNKWVYDRNYNASNKKDSYTVADTQVISGKTYFHIHFYTELTLSDAERYFRIDASNNIYELISGTEHLFLPGNPVAGQDLGNTYDFQNVGWDRKVFSVNGTITTDNCTYTNCLVIENTGSSYSSKEYYIKGLGCVYTIDYHLTTVTVK